MSAINRFSLYEGGGKIFADMLRTNIDAFPNWFQFRNMKAGMQYYAKLQM